MTHTKMLDATIPLYYQCLSIPVEWRRKTKRQKPIYGSLRALGPPEPPANEQDGDLLEVEQLFGKATTFDPWEKRNEFFRLREGDTEALLTFLRGVGVFGCLDHGWGSETATTTVVSADSGLLYDVRSGSKISEKDVWGFRRMIQRSLRKLGEHSGKHRDFQVRIEHARNGKFRLMLTTATFLDALLLTLSVDQAQGARVRKCARPDCGVSFSFTSSHKRKYCTWYCGHIESVRRRRKLIRKQKGVARGKQR